jgi:hypothetical protein
MMDPRLPAIETALGCKLPDAYLRLLTRTSGEVRADGFLLYSMGDLVERNEAFGVAEFLPGYLLIGDDSGGRGFFLLTAEQSESAVLMCDLGGLMPEYTSEIAPSLVCWEQDGFPIPP